jgi:hypothetical protein
LPMGDKTQPQNEERIDGQRMECNREIMHYPARFPRTIAAAPLSGGVAQ